MCGIVGFKTNNHFKHYEADLSKAVHSLAHRGPDDSGFFVSEASGIGFGHRRLSIIDLTSAGHQPMHSENGRYSITYNGEIYNFLDIRKNLENRGHRFKSRTDTEVILAAYTEWGIRCIDRFVGMFAFGIWDHEDQSLIIVRDRMGIKPIYYYHHDGDFIFGSELKPFRAFRQFKPPIDYSALSLFLHYQYIPTPRTIFKHTHKLPAGHYLILKMGEPEIKSYWKHPDIIASLDTEDEKTIIDELDSRLTQAVSDRLISDVPIGALLSGGIDSTLVVAIMQKVNTSATKTFTIGLEEKAFNEAPWAEKIANHLGTDHTPLYVTSRDALDIVTQLPEIYDEPFADASAIPTHLISRLTRSQVTVAISGDGGDEQFCGYVRYWSVQGMAKAFKSTPAWLRQELAILLKICPHRWIENLYFQMYPSLPQRFQMSNFSDKWDKFLKLLNLTDVSEWYRMTVCYWSKDEVVGLFGMNPPRSEFDNAFSHTNTWPILDRLMYVDQKTYLGDAMLTKVDRASMATGLEIRVPLLDHRVMAYSAKIANSLKYRYGTGKYILKKLLARYVPRELFDRPKMGFAIPLDRWLRKELKTPLLDYLSPDRLSREGLFNTQIVENTVNEHVTGKANHHYRLWPLLMWELWRERWLE